VVGAVSIGSFELSGWRLRRTRWAMGFQSVRAGCRVSLKATNRDGERHGVVFEYRIGVLSGDRKGGVWRTPSPRERTKGMACWNTPTTEVDRNKLRHRYVRRSQGCTSGIRHGQGRLEIKLAAGQPFNDEHGAGANRTSQMSCCPGSFAQCALSRSRQCDSISPRMRLAKSPKWRMRTNRFGRTWIKNRRRNSSAETVIIFCLPPCA
jgi:hypothetical protein